MESEEAVLPAVDQAVSSPQDQATGNQDTGQDQATSYHESRFTSIDPSTLPDELKPLYKSLDTDYRHKTQEVAALRSKAEAFDMVRPLMDNLSQLQNQLSPQDYGPESIMTGLTGEQILYKIIEDPAFLQNVIDERAQGIANQLVSPYAEQSLEMETRQVVQDVISRYPDLPQYEQSIVNLMEKNADLGLEDAYKIASYERARQEGVNQGVQTAQRRGQSGQPTGSSAPVKSANQPKSVFEAFEQAKRQVGWQG